MRNSFLFAFAAACTLQTAREPLAATYATPASAPAELVSPSQDDSFAEAERLFAQQSFALAREAFERAAPSLRTDSQRRWLAFRLADCRWRELAKTNQADPTEREAARAELDKLVRDVQLARDKDRVFAEVHESLGDYAWTARFQRDWGAAWAHYEQALDYWAGSTELETARRRYLDIVWKTAVPSGWNEWGNHWVPTPDEAIENAIAIAESLEDRARAHVLRATTLQHRGGDWRQLARIEREYEAALAGGAEQPWYDDALFAYAQWLENSGRVSRGPDGALRQKPDYVRAVELYDRLAREFRAGESRWRDDAAQARGRIVAPAIELSAPGIYLPRSKPSVRAKWRNCARLELALYSIDLTRDVAPIDGTEPHEWLSFVDVSKLEPAERWSRPGEDRGDHQWIESRVDLPRELAPGAYLLTANFGAKRARELVLVGDASLVVESDAKQALVWFTTAELGTPIPAARVRIHERVYDGSHWRWHSHEATTGAGGVARFELHPRSGNVALLAFAEAEGRTAFATLNASSSDEAREYWRIQALTDRPAYRPEDTVRWKIVARKRVNGRYTTPADERIALRVVDPSGAETRREIVRLSEFGSANGEVALDAAMKLGEYTVEFRRESNDGDWIGSETLFRLEEYKLPEFEVNVGAARDGETARAYRCGDEVEAHVTARYYSGGAVANATAQVVVYQRPVWIHRPVPLEFPWLHEDPEQWNPWQWYGETEVSQQTLTTDAEGRATLRFSTPLEAQSDFEYRIEARVTDASRREIVSSGSVRVARQSYYVELRSRHSVHRPGDVAEIDVEAFDPNEQPVAAEGTLAIARRRWYCIWRDARGAEIGESALRELERTNPEEARLCTVVRSGFEREVVATKPVRCGADGKASVRFDVADVGAYEIAWSSQEQDGAPIAAETWVWVAREDSTDLSWRRGQLEIVLDRDTLREGEDAVLLVTSRSGPCSVLLTVGSTEMFSWQVLELTGSAKLVRVPLDDRAVPNVFVRAQTVREGQLCQDVEELVVPPREHFLDVSVEPASPLVLPGAPCEFTIRAKDLNGRPASAEIAFAVIDESVLAIQSDYTLDPRRFFFGTRKSMHLDSSATNHARRFGRWKLDERGELIAEAEDESRRSGMAGRDDRSALAGVRLRGLGPANESDAFALGHELKSAPASPGMLRAGGKKLEQSGSEAVTVRSDFRATACWMPAVATDDAGVARIRVDMPQSLTRWRASAHACTRESRFGTGSGSTRTDLPLTIRLQAPRFFVAGDVCTISALADNHTDDPLEVAAALVRDGVAADVGDGVTTRTIPAHGQVRFDWLQRFERAGEVELEVRARAAAHSDAMSRKFRVEEHGIEQLLARSGKLPGGSGTIRFELPNARRAGSTSLTVSVSPSIAATMLDALPYLVDYPYGCVEQTMSRFLPAAIAARTLKDLGLDAESAMSRVFGGVEGEYAAKTHPKGKRSLELLGEVTSASLNRLYDMQRGDGGWGWWKTGDPDEFMTAYVAWGMSVAIRGGLDVDRSRLERALGWLDAHLVEAEAHADLAAWMLHATAEARTALDRGGPSEHERAAIEKLWKQRAQLNAYTQALFALALNAGGDERAEILADGLLDGMSLDSKPDTSIVQRGEHASDPTALATAHFGNDGIAWRWSDGAVESTSTVLRALLAIRPRHESVAPLVNWLVQNRRGAQWSSTRDSAIAVLALCDYLRLSGEAAAEVAFNVRVNGREVGRVRVERGGALNAPATFTVPIEALRDGANELEIERTSGSAPLYFALAARWFSQEEPVRELGSGVFVRREHFALVPRRTLLKGIVHERVPLRSGEPVASGTRIETIVTLEAKNDLEYVMVEDLKPAGLESVDVRSGGELYASELHAPDVEAFRRGERAGTEQQIGDRRLAVHRELRDRKTALFLSKLPQGVWEIRYEMRAEVPGTFHELPAIAQAMYVPEIRGNDAEQSFVVR